MNLFNSNTLSIRLHCASDYGLHGTDIANTFPSMTVGYMADTFHLIIIDYTCMLITLCGTLLYIMIITVSNKHHFGHLAPH